MSNFSTVLVKQSEINDITDNVAYAVKTGPSSTTMQQFEAVSKSLSSISFNVQVPSESVVVDREVLIENTLKYSLFVTVNINGVANNTDQAINLYNYGLDWSWRAFPFSSLLTTIQCNINNTSVSVNLDDIKDPLLKLIDKKQLQRYFGLCPTLTDEFYATTGGNQEPGSPYASTLNASLNDHKVYGNSSHPIVIKLVTDLAATKTAGSFYLVDGVLTYTGATGQPNTKELEFEIETTFTEPVFCSPFIFGRCEYNRQGLVGINGLNFVFNIDGNGDKSHIIFRNSAGTINPPKGTAVGDSSNLRIKLKTIESSRLLMTFYSTQPTDLIKPLNVVPYMDYVRFLSNTDFILKAGEAKSGISAPTIQINQLPDYFIIFARRKIVSDAANGSANYVGQNRTFAEIKQISVNLNNTSGLLSSATQQDLWKLSVENGSNQSWYEFSGKYGFNSSTSNINDSKTLIGQSIASSGSVLVLAPHQLSCPSYLAAGSVGQYTFQFTITLANPGNDSNVNYQLVIICCNSGVFSTLSGSSNVSTGLLTKQIVMDTQQTQSVNALSSASYDRMIGGRMGNRIASAMKKMLGPTGTYDVRGSRNKPSGGLDKYC